MTKTRIFPLILIAVICAVFYFGYNFLFPKSDYGSPIGEWEEYKLKIEAEYKNSSTDVQIAVIRYAAGFQEAIDYPERALQIVDRLTRAGACFRAVLIRDGKTFREAAVESNKIEDLMTNSFARQKRYISYNAKLSGMVFPLVGSDLKHCDFSLKGTK